MSGYYYYKNVDISDLFASGSINIDSSYNNFPVFLTTTNLAAKIDTTIPYEISGSSITDIYSISGNSETLNATGNFTLPTWCNAIKTIITTPSGNSGTPGNNGTTNNQTFPIDFQFNKSAPIPGNPTLGIPPTPGIPIGFSFNTVNKTAPGGNGGTGGSAGTGLSVQLQSPTPYIFNTGTNFSTSISSNQIQLSSSNGNLFTVNSGTSGTPGTNGGNGNFSYNSVTIPNPNILGVTIPISGLPFTVYYNITANPGSDGTPGTPGTSGTYTNGLSNNNYTIAGAPITTTTNNCQVYFFET
jgi:hypothetical protein